MKKEYLQKITNEDLNEFIEMLKSVNIQFDENKFRSIAINTIKYINGNKDTRNELRDIKDRLLLLDIADYTGKIKLKKKTYNLRKDILKATTITDLEIIKRRTENNLYKELI